MKKREIPVMNLGISINHLNLYECMPGGICCVILTKCIIGLCAYEEDGGAYQRSTIKR